MQASIDTLKKEVADLCRLSTVKDHDPPVRSYAKAVVSRPSHPRYHSNSKSQGTATSSAKIQTHEICPAAVQAANSANNCVRTTSEAKTKSPGRQDGMGNDEKCDCFCCYLHS